MKFRTLLDLLFLYGLITFGNFIVYRNSAPIVQTIAHKLGYVSVPECVQLIGAAERD